MFEARLVQGRLLKTVLETVKDQMMEATLECTEEGIQLQAMDNWHVSLMTVNIRADSFDKFRCDRTISVGVNLVKMYKIIRYLDNEDTLTIKVEDEAEAVTFTFEGPNRRKVSDCRLKVTKLDREHLGIPESSYSAVIKMPSGEFQRIVRALSQFGKWLVIRCTKEGVKFSAAGDFGTGNIMLTQTDNVDEEEKAVIIEMQKPVILTFACRYLNMFTKASCLADQVSLSMSLDVPLVIEYNIDVIGHVRFYLAPLIED